MSKEDLNESLERLRAEIRNVDPDDPEARNALEALNNEIEAVLGESPEDEEDRRGALFEQLQDSIDRFEASHPQLTALANRVMMTLSNMGI